MARDVGGGKTQRALCFKIAVGRLFLSDLLLASVMELAKKVLLKLYASLEFGLCPIRSGA